MTILQMGPRGQEALRRLLDHYSEDEHRKYLDALREGNEALINDHLWLSIKWLRLFLKMDPEDVDAEELREIAAIEAGKEIA